MWKRRHESVACENDSQSETLRRRERERLQWDWTNCSLSPAAQCCARQREGRQSIWMGHYVCMCECDTLGYVYNADVILISQSVTCSTLQKLEKGCDGTVKHWLDILIFFNPWMMLLTSLTDIWLSNETQHAALMWRLSLHLKAVNEPPVRSHNVPQCTCVLLLSSKLPCAAVGL